MKRIKSGTLIKVVRSAPADGQDAIHDLIGQQFRVLKWHEDDNAVSVKVKCGEIILQRKEFVICP